MPIKYYSMIEKFKIKRNDNLPLIDECIHRRLYKIRCRNLNYGVWNNKAKGFIGIREKFKQEYLFTEYHYDVDKSYGTVFEAIDTGIDVPGEIELRERFSTEDEITGRLVLFDEPIVDGGRGWYFVDTNEASQDIHPVSKRYKPLFDWLTEKEKELNVKLFNNNR